MPRKEILTLGEFLYLLDEEQKVKLFFSGLEVSGTQDSISCIANNETNAMRVINVGAEDDFVEVWLEGAHDA